uniref:TSA: Wollemia nobilis Ref_Wollemi_Transcript_10503_3435 transcribed RNA sequence n=1 Tax=Wollemia nobilis TaxID=56998 RepID=A0A0C9S6U6_9CONI
MRSPLGKIGALSQKINPLGALSQNHRHAVSELSRNIPSSQVTSGQNSSPAIPSERRGRVKSSKKIEINVSSENLAHSKGHEHRIDIGDENTDLLGQLLLSGKLVPDKKDSGSGLDNQALKSKESKAEVDAKLTTKAFVWGSHRLRLFDIIAVSCSEGVRRFTVHSCALVKKAWVPFGKSQRKRKDFHFLASTPEDALRWVSAFADQQLFVNCLPHPLLSSKQQGSIMDARDFASREAIKCKIPAMLVILNPRSGRGRSSKVFYGKVEPIFKLAGIKLEVVETTSAGHARTLASTVDLSTCPDGIICVGGDGIINEVLNGLINRDDPKEAMTVPIGIIPAGSDNSLVWTVLGVRDPITAALSIVKGGLTATDVFAVEWIQTGDMHAGLTVAYYGFVSDVLELSEKYQKRFGPFRYFVAGALKFLCLPKYEYEVEYLPVSEPNTNIGSTGVKQGSIDATDNQSDMFGRKSNIEGLPRASSLSSIDSMLMTPSRMSGDIDIITGSTYASSEPSEYVRALDAKTKRLSSGRNNLPPEPEEVVHPSLPGSATPTRPRTRIKSRTGLNSTNDSSRCSWANTMVLDREDISSTMSDPGPIWDAEARWDTGPKWDAEPRWDIENNFDVKGSIDEMLEESNHEMQKIEEEKWVVKQGPFLGVLICNHQCKTVQNLRSQVLAPRAEHDDNSLDLLLVRGVGRLQLLRFFVLMQFGRHLSLPFVEYTKVKSVKLKPGKNVHQGCGIDGELRALNGPISTYLLPEQCKLIGRPILHSG